MNLRDQLVKAGLRSKKDAKKAANKVKNEKKKKQKAVKKGEDFETESEAISKNIKEQKAKSKERDLELNKKIEKEREEKEKKYRAVEIIYSNQVYELNASNCYYFIENQLVVRSIYVTDSQLFQLSHGLMGIARETLDSTDYKLVPYSECLRVIELFPELVVCLHPKTQKEAS